MAKLYLAGPMTGLPEWNYPAFREAARQLREVGYFVVNPAEHGLDPDDPNIAWAEWLKRGIKDLVECHGVAVLPGWENSRGAQLECQIALTLDMEVKPVEDWMY